VFILPVKYEYGESWWNAIDRGKLMIRPPELSSNLSSSHVVAEEEKVGEGNDEFGLRSFFVHLRGDFIHAVKSYDNGPALLLPLQGKACCGLYRLSQTETLERGKKSRRRVLTR
jgi:hypothetical protein